MNMKMETETDTMNKIETEEIDAITQFARGDNITQAIRCSTYFTVIVLFIALALWCNCRQQ